MMQLRPRYNEGYFSACNISHTILRFHADLIVNHNTLYHPSSSPSPSLGYVSY